MKNGFRYPKASELQAGMTTQLTGNPPRRPSYELNIKIPVEVSLRDIKDAATYTDADGYGVETFAGAETQVIQGRTYRLVTFTIADASKVATIKAALRDLGAQITAEGSRNPSSDPWEVIWWEIDDQTEAGGGARWVRCTKGFLHETNAEAFANKQRRLWPEKASAVLVRKRNPYEVHSEKGHEDTFARPEDAEYFAGELSRAGVRGVKVQKRPRKGKQNPLDESGFDTAILDGMARAIWVTAWASWVNELTKADRKAAGAPISLQGDLDDLAPETPDSAVRAAKDLYLLIERANLGKTPGELFQRACEVDGCEWDDDNADLFGHYVAMQAMGEGVSWFDDHAEFPLKFPRGFEAHYDDGDVWWSPQVRARQNGRSR